MSFFQQEDPVEVHSSDPVCCIDQLLHVYCHEHMTLLLEILRNEAGFCSRKVLAEGLQQDLYDFIIKKTKELVFEELTDLLAEASWMSE